MVRCAELTDKSTTGRLTGQKDHLRNCCINSWCVSTTAKAPGHNSSLHIAAASSLQRKTLHQHVIMVELSTDLTDERTATVSLAGVLTRDSPGTKERGMEPKPAQCGINLE